MDEATTQNAVGKTCEVCGKPNGSVRSTMCAECRATGGEIPFAARPCKKCGKSFRSKNPGRAKYCDDCAPASRQRMREHRARLEAEKEVRVAAEQQAKEQTAKERKEAKRQQELTEFGPEAVRQRDNEDMLATLLSECVSYAKGEPSVITNDDDFAEYFDWFEELYAKYEHRDRQRYAIEFAFLAARDKASTGQNFSWFQRQFDWLLKAFPEKVEFFRSVPELPVPPPDVCAAYWSGKWEKEHPPKPILQSSWRAVWGADYRGAGVGIRKSLE